MTGPSSRYRYREHSAEPVADRHSQRSRVRYPTRAIFMQPLRLTVYPTGMYGQRSELNIVFPVLILKNRYSAMFFNRKRLETPPNLANITFLKGKINFLFTNID